jgi:predicted nucleotidyltransferase
MSDDRAAIESRVRPAETWRTALHEFTEDLRALYGSRLDRVILHGSRARGDAEPLSDVDVLVVLDQCPDFWREFHRISPIASRVSLAHDVVLSALPTSVEEFSEADSSLFAHARQDGVPVA